MTDQPAEQKTPELLPCPMCGGTNLTTRWGGGGIRCLNVACYVNIQPEAWNSLSRMQQERGELKSTLDFCREWYAARWERLHEFIAKSDKVDDEFRATVCHCIANGTASPHEPPTYAQILSTKQHEIDAMRAERDELKALLIDVWRSELEQSRIAHADVHSQRLSKARTRLLAKARELAQENKNDTTK